MNKKFIAWGATSSSDTLYYVIQGYIKAFTKLGYECYHLDNNDDVSNINFDNSIFFTTGNYHDKIPIKTNCKYVLHNCSNVEKFDKNSLILQVYTTDVINRKNEEKSNKIDHCVWFSEKTRTLYQPWATDLLPEEIEENYEHKAYNTCVWIGSVWGGEHGNTNEIARLRQNCINNKYYFSAFTSNKISFAENRNIVYMSEIAPTFNGDWQKRKHYISCRVFKNISYGKPCITNNQAVFELLEGNAILCEPEKTIESYKMYSVNELAIIFNKSAKIVKEKHTFLNRAKQIIDLI